MKWEPQHLGFEGPVPSVTGSLLAVYRLESSLHFQLPLGRKGIWALRAAFIHEMLRTTMALD